MDRREMLGALGVGAFGLMASTAHGAQAGKQQGHAHDQIAQDCLEACAECVQACDQGFQHCFSQVAEGKSEHAKSMRLLSDCAGFCGLSACMIGRGSPLMVHSCNACAEACETTLAEVQTHSSDPEMKKAVEKLTACKESCEKMVKAMHGQEHQHERPA